MNIQNLKESADNGSTVSASMLGIFYLNGIEVEQDYDKALLYLSLASKERSPRAMANLGRMYEKGLGVAIDLNRAAELYQDSAELGEFMPHVWLARMLVNAGYHEDALEYYEHALTFKEKVMECDELTEASKYVELNKPAISP